MYALKYKNLLSQTWKKVHAKQTPVAKFETVCKFGNKHTKKEKGYFKFQINLDFLTFYVYLELENVM